MINRRMFWFALIPFCMAGGALLRAKEKVEASKVVPQRWRQPAYQYAWTDGNTVWYSAYDVPPDAKNVVMKFGDFF